MWNVLKVYSIILLVFLLHFQIYYCMITVLKIGNITLHLDKGVVSLKNGTITIENTNLSYDLKLEDKDISTKILHGTKQSDSSEQVHNIDTIEENEKYSKRQEYHYDMSVEKEKTTKAMPKESTEEFTTVKTNDPCANVCMDLTSDDVEPVCLMYSRYKKGYHWFMNHCHARRAICLENLDLHFVHPSRCMKSLQFFMPII